MKKIIIGSLVGGLVGYIWGMMVWMALPLYSNTMDQLPDEAAFIATLSESSYKTGAYYFPNMPSDMSDKQAMAHYEMKHEAGPVGFMVLHPEGKASMAPAVMGRGVLFNLVSAFALSIILSLSAIPSFTKRVAVVLAVGLFFVCMGPLMFWNWMQFPWDYTLASILDAMGRALVVGLVLAAIVKPSKA